MTVKRLYVSLPALVLAALFLVLTGCSGGGENTPDENTVPPSITSLDRNAASVGDQINISGQRFGATMGDSTVTLNGMAFQIVAWTDTLLSVTVAEGMTSGIVVVNVDGAPSTSGQEAQLFIPNAPVGDPVLSAISPAFGTEGEDEVLLTGFNFGDGTGDSGVYFPAKGGAVSQAGGVVLASVVTVDIDGSPVPQWSNSSVKVIIPDNSESGQVFVRVNGIDTNAKPFSVMPRGVTGPPVISSLNPTSGGFNSPVTISGENFGHKRGSSTLTINDDAMVIVTWSNSEVVALVPNGATSGPIRITVGGQFAESDVFEIENAPVITGLSPTELRVGKPVTITGKNFGFDQGAGTLTIGSTTITPDTWKNDMIWVEQLPVITFADADAVSVKVTNNSGAADVIYGIVRTDLQVFVNGTPTAGEADNTEFSFFITVIGGSGSYQYSLIPDASNPQTKTAPSITSPIVYKYLSSLVSQPTTFQTRVEVKDTVSGDVSVVDGPEIYVVPQGLAVISTIELFDFNYPAADAPKNDWVYNWVPPLFAELLYKDFTFFNDEIYYGSAMGELMDGPNPVTGITRDLSMFKSGNPTARPYGYRYAPGQGSIVRINGLNLGTSGEIYLNSNGPASAKPGYQLGAGDLVPGGWTADYIDFYMPQDVFQNLSGKLVVVTGGFEVQSSTDLICSSLVRDVQPAGEIEPTGSFSITGYDFEVPEVAGVTGDQTSLMFIVQADWDDPGSGVPQTGPALLARPMPVDPSGGSILFDMNDLVGSGFIEVFNGAGDQATFVPPTALVQGQYHVWIWGGALADGTDYERANSGIFSQSFTIQVGDGGGGPGDTWSVSGFTQIGGLPPTPIPNIEVHIENKPGFPTYTDTVMSNAATEYMFTNVPGDADYFVWCDDPGYLWPGPREIINLTADVTNFFINANSVAP